VLLFAAGEPTVMHQLSGLKGQLGGSNLVGM
jgi:hypothetical protein